ncbi:MAG: hypothetical protein AB1465_05100 [Patescibacteria group bacterium]
MQVKPRKLKKWKRILTEWAGNDYDKAVLTFAKRWAERMEGEFKGSFSHEVAARTKMEEISVEKLTNHMYCAAADLLVDVWVFGEELRQWHNIVRASNLSLAIRANVEGGVIYS